jgi:hypothetical protein
MASRPVSTARRPRKPDEHSLAETVKDDLHHLVEIEEKGESPLAALLVIVQVMLLVFALVAVLTTVAMVFYFGWL